MIPDDAMAIALILALVVSAVFVLGLLYVLYLVLGGGDRSAGRVAEKASHLDVEDWEDDEDTSRYGEKGSTDDVSKVGQGGK